MKPFTQCLSQGKRPDRYETRFVPASQEATERSSKGGFSAMTSEVAAAPGRDAPSRLASRYSLGVQPWQERKTRLKLASEANPLSRASAISLSCDRQGSASRRRASAIRQEFRNTRK